MKYTVIALLLINLFNFNNCGLRQEIIYLLKSEFRESPINWDISDSTILELYASKNFRTWSIIITNQDNLQLSCIIAYGRGKHSLPFTYNHGEDT